MSPHKYLCNEAIHHGLELLGEEGHVVMAIV